MWSITRRYEAKTFLFLTGIVITFFLIFYNSGVRYDFVTLSLYFIIGILSLYGLLLSVDKNAYSINKTFNLFFYFFFSIAPAIQFKSQSTFFITTYLPKELYLKIGLILLLINVIYLLGYHFLYQMITNKTEGNQSITNDNINNSKSYKSILLLYVMTVGAFLLYLYLIKFNWSLLVFRPFLFRLKFNTNFGLLGYSLLLIIQFIPVIVFLYYKFSKKKNDVHTYFFLLILLLIAFPTSLSRSLLAIIYIPIMIVLIPSLKKGINYVLLFLGGILIVFPLFNNFRYLKEGVFKFNYELFNSGHFDAFQNLALLIDTQIVTYGRQLVGSIFFFIQESNWLQKPTGTGQLLAETIGYSYTNVSMPYFGEGYANAGYLGIFLFLIFIILVNAFLDVKIRYKKNPYFNTVYILLLGFEFYLLRGDLMSSAKIFVSFIIAIVIVELVIQFFKLKTTN